MQGSLIEVERKPVQDYWLLAIAMTQGEPLPEGWQIFRYEALMDRDENALLLGAVAPLKTRGKNKGRRDWSRRDRATERTFVISTRQRRAAELHFESTTGMCYACGGNGTAWAGWSAAAGNRYKPCTRCKSTGASPEVPATTEVSHGG